MTYTESAQYVSPEKYQGGHKYLHLTRLCQPELLVAAEPAAVEECTSEMWVGLAQLNIAQQLCSAYCTAGWM